MILKNDLHVNRKLNCSMYTFSIMGMLANLACVILWTQMSYWLCKYNLEVRLYNPIYKASFDTLQSQLWPLWHSHFQTQTHHRMSYFSKLPLWQAKCTQCLVIRDAHISKYIYIALVSEGTLDIYKCLNMQQNVPTSL